MSTTDDTPVEPGLGTMLAAAIFSFTTVTLLALYLTMYNATQAVLIGGISAIVSSWAAMRAGKRAAKTDAE